MKLTPLDIRRNEFSRAMRGYNREEVESFLTMVADEVEGLVGEHRETTRRVSELQKEIEDYRKLERSLMDTLVSAQKAADEMRESSQREAEVIRREAQVRSEQLVENARIEAERLLVEARRKGHAVLEDAHNTAHEALEEARGQAEQILERARQSAAEIESQMRALVARRDTFVAGMRAYLSGQIDALAILEGDTPQNADAPRLDDVPVITDEEVEALAALDRELAEFAAETVPPTTDLTPDANRSEASERSGEADGGSAEGEASNVGDDSEVLIDRREEGNE